MVRSLSALAAPPLRGSESNSDDGSVAPRSGRPSEPLLWPRSSQRSSRSRAFRRRRGARALPRAPRVRGWRAPWRSIRRSCSGGRQPTRLFEERVDVKQRFVVEVSPSVDGDGGAEISFGAWCAPGLVAAAPASQIVRGLSVGQTNGGACRDIGGRARGAPLEGFVACEDVPAGDQDLARDRGLGGTSLAVALLGLGVEPMPGVGRSPRAL